MTLINYVDLVIQSYDLPSLLRSYHWQGQSLASAWKERVRLEQLVKSWCNNDFIPGEGSVVADSINMWGFGRPLQKQDDNWETKFRRALLELDHGHEEASSLTLLENTDGGGIATISKFLAFRDQERFVIFDSRVGFALRVLTVEEFGLKKRVFPCPPWRTSPPVRTGDSINPNKAAQAFAACNELCRSIAERLGMFKGDLAHMGLGEKWKAAHVETALFMAGSERDREKLQLPVIRYRKAR